jgi:hypothetical protein
VELWEAIISNLKEPKTQEHPSGQEFILHQIQGPQDFVEKNFFVYLG